MRNRRSKSIIAIIVMVAIMTSFLQGCTKEAPYKEGAAFGDPEFLPWSGEVTERNDFKSILTEGEETTVGGHRYIFEKGIDEGVKRDFVAKQELLISTLKHEEAGYTFYITKSYVDRGDSVAGETFTAVESIGTWKQVLSMIFLLEGDNSLYGYAYAKALSVAKSLGWEGDKDQDKASKFVGSIGEMLKSDPGRLHLFLPCFIEPYSTAKQIICAKLLAVQIYDSLDEATEESFEAALENYAEEHSIEYVKLDCDFTYGGQRTPLIMETPYTVEYVPNSFTNDIAYTRKLGITENSKVGSAESAWLYNMTELVRVRNLLNDSMASAKDAIAPSLDSKCEVEYVQAGTGGYYQSRYEIDKNKIVLYLIHELAHEYVHYLHLPQIAQSAESLESKWIEEGLAMWYGREVEIDFINILREITNYHRGAMDMDFYLYQNRGYVHDMALEGKSVRELLSEGINVSYPTSLEMTRYFIEEYGEEAMIDFYLFRKYTENEMQSKMNEYIDEFEAFIKTVEVPEVWEYFGEDPPNDDA